MNNINATNKKRIVDFDGDFIKMDSQRYYLFKRDGCKCVNCGIEGTFFRKERDENNQEVMITKDHIIPKSKGGPNSMKNYQVLCYTCNQEKKNNI